MSYPDDWSPISKTIDFIDSLDEKGARVNHKYFGGLERIGNAQHLPDNADETINNWWVCRGGNLNTTLSLSRRHPFPLMALHPVLFDKKGLPKLLEERFFHELSHCISRFFLQGKGHGSEWKLCMESFGYPQMALHTGRMREWFTQRKLTRWQLRQANAAFKELL